MKDLTIVSAVTPEYLESLRRSYYSWKMKSELKKSPKIIFYSKLSPNKLSFIKHAKLIEWNMSNAANQRENILSAFVLGTSKYVETTHWLKIDADSYFSNNQEFLNKELFKYDLVASKWNYTKPAIWINQLDRWATENNIPGENFSTKLDSELGNAYGHKRIISWICLHKTDFVIECALLAKDKLPVPSHDTYLWYMCNRLPHRNWTTFHFKKYGAEHKKKVNFSGAKFLNSNPILLHAPGGDKFGFKSHLKYLSDVKFQHVVPDDLSIITISNAKVEKCFERSCKINNINLIILGKDLINFKFIDKIKIILDFIKNVKTKYILFCDCFDVCFCNKIDNILELFNSYNCDILFSAENNHHPDDAPTKDFENSISNRYLNTGMFIAKSDKICEILNQVDFNENDDQKCCKILYKRLYPKIKIDFDNKLFLNLQRGISINSMNYEYKIH